MKKKKNQALTIIALTSALSALALWSAFGQSASRSGTHAFVRPVPANVSVFATGLNNPRGLKFGPDGNLYVAEAGIGGSDSTVGCCEQALRVLGRIWVASLARASPRSMPTALSRQQWIIFPQSDKSGDWQSDQRRIRCRLYRKHPLHPARRSGLLAWCSAGAGAAQRRDPASIQTAPST